MKTLMHELLVRFLVIGAAVFVRLHRRSGREVTDHVEENRKTQVQRGFYDLFLGMIWGRPAGKKG